MIAAGKHMPLPLPKPKFAEVEVRKHDGKGNGNLAKSDVDARVAAAIARTETGIRRRGKLRVQMQIQRAGIDKTTAKRAVDEVFDAIDDDALIDASLQKRLHGRETIADDREFQRLYRFLATQGFESDKIMKALRARRPRTRTQRITEDTDD